MHKDPYVLQTHSVPLEIAAVSMLDQELLIALLSMQPLRMLKFWETEQSLSPINQHIIHLCHAHYIHGRIVSLPQEATTIQQLVLAYLLMPQTKHMKLTYAVIGIYIHSIKLLLQRYRLSLPLLLLFPSFNFQLEYLILQLSS